MSFSAHEQFNALGDRFHSADTSQIKRLSYGKCRTDILLDETDKKILTALTQLGEYSYSEIAAITGVTSVTVKTRITALEDQGLIQGYKYRIDNNIINRNSYKLLVYTYGFSKEFNTKLLNLCIKDLNIYNQVRCIGLWRYELGYSCDNPLDVQVFRRRIQTKFEDYIRKIEILPIYKQYKFRSFPPLI